MLAGPGLPYCALIVVVRLCLCLVVVCSVSCLFLLCFSFCSWAFLSLCLFLSTPPDGCHARTHGTVPRAPRCITSGFVFFLFTCAWFNIIGSGSHIWCDLDLIRHIRLLPGRENTKQNKTKQNYYFIFCARMATVKLMI